MFFATNVAYPNAGVTMVEQVLVTIFVWVAVFVYWHRAIEDVRGGTSPLRNMAIGVVCLSSVLAIALIRDYSEGALLCIFCAAVLAIALQLWVAFLIGVRASEENNID